MRPKLTLLHLLQVRRLAMAAKMWIYRNVYGMDIDPSVEFSLSAHFDRTHPKGIHVGAQSLIAIDTVILAHDRPRNLFADTRIGERCFVGARCVILPGITIGDECIVAAGAVVTRDVPPRTIVAGNPARVIRENIDVVRYGSFREDHLRALAERAEKEEAREAAKQARPLRRLLRRSRRPRSPRPSRDSPLS